MSLALNNNSYQPLPYTLQVEEQPIQLDIKDQEWEIRDEALQYQRDGQYIEAAKNYIRLFDNSISTPLDIKSLITILYKLINHSIECILDFSFEEINSIISACKLAVPLNEDDRLKTELLLNHLNSKMSELCKKNQNIMYHSIPDKQNFLKQVQQNYVNISREEPFLTLASIGYPSTFFMPQPEGFESELQWSIRDLAVKSNNKKEYAKAVKLYIKLLVNAIDQPTDKIRINKIIYEKINTSGFPIFDFNFNEIQAILFSCKNANTHNEEAISKNKFLIEHLRLKTNNLLEDIESNTRKARLLLKSFEDKGSEFASLPRELIQTISWIYLAVIADIGQTPVNISLT